MNILANKLKTIFVPVLAAVFLASSLVALFPQKTFAQGEEYDWRPGQVGINATGGVYASPPTTESDGTGLGRFSYVSVSPTGTVLFGRVSGSGVQNPGSTFRGSQTVVIEEESPLGSDQSTCVVQFNIVIEEIDLTRGTNTTYSTATITAQSGTDTNPCNDVAARHDQTLTRNIEIIGQAPEGVGLTDGGVASTTSSQDLCGENAGELGFLACPMQDWMGQAVLWADQVIMDQLKIDTEEIFADAPTTPEEETDDQDRLSSNAFHTAWAAFRTLAYALLIIFGLVMVVSQIAGLDIFDAYTIRKMLPKMVFAAIAIPLLWPLLAFVFNMANDAADAVWALIFSPFSAIPPYVTADGTVIDPGEMEIGSVAVLAVLSAAMVGALAFIAPQAFAIILTLIASVFLFIISALFILLARDIVAYILIIVSPIAVVCAAFEPFRRFFTLWRTLLTTILLSIPAIAAVLAASKVAAVVAMLIN